MDTSKEQINQQIKEKDYNTDNTQINTKEKDNKTRKINLRIREDTAKYLRNLDIDSVYYDPNTRSMKNFPLPN